MRLYPFLIPNTLKKIYPSLIWEINTDQDEVFITFDDGPHPEVTPWVLDMLEEFGMKATFFVVGENAAKYPTICKRILDEGHAIGNHTYHHISGYKHELEAYLEDVQRCSDVVSTGLFRPPYGRIKRNQIQALKKEYKIVMWNQLSGDFDASLNIQHSLDALMNNSKPGNIIVFHDSAKAFPQLQKLLRPYLEHLKKIKLQGNSMH